MPSPSPLRPAWSAAACPVCLLLLRGGLLHPAAPVAFGTLCLGGGNDHSRCQSSVRSLEHWGRLVAAHSAAAVVPVGDGGGAGVVGVVEVGEVLFLIERRVFKPEMSV